MATPMTARSTTGATFRRTATGCETATTTSKVARTGGNRKISSIEAESYPVAALGGKIAARGPMGGAVSVFGRPAEPAALGDARDCSGSTVAGQSLRLVWAKIDDHAHAAQRLPRHA